jgi:hypothetical protein
MDGWIDHGFIHIHIHTHTHTRAHVHTLARTHTYMHIHTRTFNTALCGRFWSQYYMHLFCDFYTECSTAHVHVIVYICILNTTLCDGCEHIVDVYIISQHYIIASYVNNPHVVF